MPCLDSRGRCGALLSFHPCSRQATVACARSTFLFRSLICYHDKLARRSFRVRAYHWMLRSLHIFIFASSREGRRSGKISLVAVISKDIMFLLSLHVTANAIVQTHLACMWKSVPVQPLKFMNRVNMFLSGLLLLASLNVYIRPMKAGMYLEISPGAHYKTCRSSREQSD